MAVRSEPACVYALAMSDAGSDGDQVLSPAAIARVAKLARLRLPEATLERMRSELERVLEHARDLNELDLEGVEPMTSPLDPGNRWAEDEAGATLGLAALEGMSPAMDGRFIAVPKVLGEGGGA